MNTIRYVFTTKKPELQKLVVKYGLSPARTEQEFWQKTNFLISRFREDFMKDIADIHPDRELFAWRFSLDNNIDNDNQQTSSELNNIANNIKVESTSGCSGEKTSNCCGSGVDGEKTSNCCGSGFDGNKNSDCNGCSSMQSGIDGTQIKEKIKDNMPLVIIGSLALVFGVIALTRKSA